MGLKKEVSRVIANGSEQQLQELVEQHAGAVRHLLALTYQADSVVRERAAHGVALAGHHHPRLVRRVIERLLWAMNDESGTNAQTAPLVLRAIARETPQLLETAVPELNRAAQEDENIGGLARQVLQELGRVPEIAGQWPEIFTGLQEAEE
ncbi:MAG: hypothetical protein DRI34_03235 [Deltaproteobacteria bacterium]|nr:MAG: hypothetical protein DRI34_03235 [Deltaproteobacteria bacterium]